MDSMEINPIIKEVATGCNLRCKYCFYAYQNQEKKEMTPDVLENIVSEICRCNTGDIRFYWHGGEPLVEKIEFYEKAIELQKKFKKSDQKIYNGFQTNATLINERWVEFFKRNNILLGVSFDGPAEYHDYYRQYPNGKGSFEKAIKGIRLLKEAGIKFGVVSVVTNLSAREAEKIFDFFLSQKITNTVNFVPAIGIETGKGISFENSVQPSLYVNFLIKIFDLWLAQDNPNFKILPLESIIRAFLDFSQEDCRFAGVCEKNLVIDYNGDVFPCSTYGYGDFFKFGNIKKGIDSIFESQSFQNYRQYLRKIEEKCCECRWNKVCHGNCAHYHYLGGGENIFCKDLQRLFHYIQKSLQGYRLIC